MMRYGKALFLVIIVFLVFNAFVYADFPKNISITRNEEVKNTIFPIPQGFEIVISASTSMSGTIKFTSPTNVVQNVPVQYTAGGWSTQVNLTEVGTYSILETYNLTASISFPGITPETVTETRSSTYNNTSAGNKTISMTSTVSGFAMSLPPGKFAVISITPSSIQPGQSISATLRSTEAIDLGEVIFTSANLQAVWNVTSLAITGGPPANTPPAVSINSAIQSGPNGDVQVAYTLQDTENNPCTITALYSKDGTSWSGATIVGDVSNVSPGSRSLAWKAYQDEPSGQGAYQFKIKANDGTSDSQWSAPTTVNLNNTPPASNNPPQALNLRIRTIDANTNQEPVPYHEPFTGNKLKAGYDFFDPDGDLEAGSELQWYKNNVPFGDLIVIQNDQNKILGVTVVRGEKWAFSITPNDGKTKGEPRNSGIITINNAPPSVRNLRFQPLQPTSTTGVKALFDYSDPENDPQGTHEIRWYKAEPQSSQYILQPQHNNKDTLQPSDVKRGERWKFTIIPKDALGGTGELAESIPVTIVNQKPYIQNVKAVGSTGDISITFDLVDQDGDKCELRTWYRRIPAEPTAAIIREASSPDKRYIITNVSPANGLRVTWLSKENEPSGKGDYVFGITPFDDMDEGDEGFSQVFTLDNNDSPTANDVKISPESPNTSNDLFANYVYQDPNNDPEVGSKIRWYRNKTEQSEYRDLKTLPSSATAKGDEWYFTVEPSDGKEFGPIVQSAPVRIKNTPPQLSSVRLEPTNATSEDDLIASYVYLDADNDPETGTQVRWYVDGNLKPEYNDKFTVPKTATLKDQVWYFTIKTTDGTDPSALVESNRVKLGNVAPSITNLFVPEEGFRDVPITFDLVDPNNDTCSLIIEYQGGLASNWTPATIKEPLTGLLPGHITLTWQSNKDQDVREAVIFRIRVTPNDGSSSGIPVVSTPIKLDNNIPPIASNLRISPPNPTTSDNLVVTYDFYDEDGGMDMGTEFTWYRNGVISNFKGVGQNILPSSSTLKGEEWYCIVKPKDGARFGNPVKSPVVTIANSPPVLKSVEILPATPRSDAKLTVKYDYRDVDDDKESGTEVEWYRNGEPKFKKVIVSEADKVLPLAIAKGEKWHVIVTPSDGFDRGVPMTSASVTISNSAPKIENLTVSGNSGNIAITFDLIDLDNDNCDIMIEYQGGTASVNWVKATTLEPTTKISPTKGLRFTWVSRTDELGNKSDDYRVRVTPNDGSLTGDTVVSNKFTINNNSLPSASSLRILPELPKSSDDLQVSYTFVDADGDKEGQPEIKWYKNGTHQVIYDNRKVLPSSATTKGDRWYYTIKVFDGKDYGGMQQSSSVTIVNAPPTAIDVKLSPDYPKIGQSLVASYRYQDDDNDSEQGTKIEWYKNGAYQKDYDNLKTIPGNILVSGEEWYFTVRPKDGFDFGLPVQSNKVYIANLPPQVSSLSISPSNPLTTDNLIASYVYVDPENDPESGSKISWYKNNVIQTKYNDQLIVPSDATARRQVWYFTVEPKDGRQFGELKQSGSVSIGNTPPKVTNVVLSPPYPLRTDDLVASYDYFDADGDPEGRTEIKWYKNNILMSKYDGLKKVPSKDLSDREVWYFTVRPKDDSDFGEVQTSNKVEIGNPIPRVNNLFIKPDNPLTTDDLVANYTYIDPNGIPESGSLITWYKNGVAQSEYNDLKILPSSATRKGERWNFSVKPKNGSLFGEEQSSAPVVIANSIPKITTVIPQPQEPTTDDDILADYMFNDPDGDKEAKNEIRWYRNGVLQTDYDNFTKLPSSATKRNEEWYYTVRASDGTSFSELATSVKFRIRNGKPKVTDVVISPANPKTTDDLIVSYKYADTENDPESGTEVIWYKNNVNQQEFHNLKVVPASATVKGDRWYCTVTPRDGMDFGNPVSSSIVSISNTNPVASDISAVVSQVSRGGTVSIIAIGKDVDETDAGPALKCQISYKIGNTPWVPLNVEYVESPNPQWKANFSPDANAVLGDYDFRAKFVDSSQAESDWLEKYRLVTVNNSLPVISSSLDDLRVTEDTVREFDLTDFGSDYENGKNLTWVLDENSVDNNLFSARMLHGKVLEITPVHDKNGKDDITLIITDADGGKTEKKDVTIIIDPVNDLPTIPTVVKITPENPTTLDTLVCEPSGSTDPDGDSVIYRYQWYKNGVAQSDLKSRDVHFSKTAKGEVWKCEVTPSDGIVDGPSKSVEVKIGNSAPSITNIKVSGNTKDIKITFDLDDPDNDVCDLKLEYRLKGGIWKSASTSGVLNGVNPAKSLSLIWQSYSNEPNVAVSDCKLRLTANDRSINSEIKESDSFLLDNKPPEFVLTAVVNPVYDAYVDVNVRTDEELKDPLPEVSVKLSEEETIKLEMKKIAERTWTGMLKLQRGYKGNVLFTVKAYDIYDNEGKAELLREFNIPPPDPKPDKFVLGQNYPNPIVIGTNIPYELPESSNVSLEIYNSNGQLVRKIDVGYKSAGYYVVENRAIYWDGKDEFGLPVASGVYFYYLKANNFEGVKKMAVKR